MKTERLDGFYGEGTGHLPGFIAANNENNMRVWFRNVILAIKTVGQGMGITLWYFFQTYKRQAFTQQFEYPEVPVPVKPRYRGFHRFDVGQAPIVGSLASFDHALARNR